MAAGFSVTRKSWLYVPLHKPRFAEKATELDPDVVVLDLEDGCPANLKQVGRESLPTAHQVVRQAHQTVFVRVNNTEDAIGADLEACRRAGVTRVVLPKANDPAEVQRAAEFLRSGDGRADDVELALILESARGIRHAVELATADEAVTTIIAGTEDLAWDLGVDLGPEGAEIRHAKLMVVLAAAEAGVIPIGLLGRIGDYRDIATMRQIAQESYRHGFRGANCIHPAQIPALNEGFSPSPERVAAARRLVEHYDAIAGPDAGAIAFEGQMLDGPIVERAREILESDRV